MPDRRHFGTVRKRSSGRWQAMYWHGGKRFSSGTFAAKADAQAWLANEEVDHRRGAWIDPTVGKVTLRDYSARWLSRRPELAIRTREFYEDLLRLHILPELGSSTLADISPSKVRGWNAQLTSVYPSTASKAYRLLATMMRTAYDDGLILKSPCKVKGASIEHAAERPMATISEVESLTLAMPDRLRLVILLATWCQLRRGEILGLRRCDVDLLHTSLRIAQSRTFARDGSSIVKSPKTLAGYRNLSIPSNIIDDLEAHLEKWTESGKDSLLFTLKNGVPLSATSLQRAWSKARASIGRQDLHLHDLRHTGLTLAAATGATTAELMHRAGHSSPGAALRYQHATRDRDQVLADALAQLVQTNNVTEISSRDSTIGVEFKFIAIS